MSDNITMLAWALIAAGLVGFQLHTYAGPPPDVDTDLDSFD